ncbi:BMP family ABC transporter substrate-binding protein [Halocella sp. SP3-1]|uniref:BMP family lipoprotein n=1 Tax=Halocella sp. SP3-1 TaxID=2382161 RepID=UPI000F759A88|nr:BMP family ABC transporter substrate-binding protein [Halocella sp. SP3-1]AZO93497.1 BMP family ABC transporter substrate-binding protein [Halocella sp. SP3-1]
MIKKRYQIILSAGLILCFMGLIVVAGNGNVVAANKKVALITSMGGLGDRSFNDMAYKGLQEVEEKLNIEYKIVEPDAVTEGERYLASLAQMGYDLILTLEYGHADMVERVAPQFPDKIFAVFNLVVDQPNVVSVVFKEHDASFLAGALAAMVTSNTDIEGINEKKMIGVIGGVDSPGINKFMVAYEEGAHYINSEVEVLQSYANSFADPSTGREMALVQMDRGADIVFQVAGATGQGIIEAAAQEGKYAIGVDANQDYMAKGNVLTSVMKRMDIAVYDLCEKLEKGLLEGGEVITLGLEENGVSLTLMEYTKDKIPAEYIEKVKKLEKEIISGQIEVTDVSQ